MSTASVYVPRDSPIHRLGAGRKLLGRYLAGHGQFVAGGEQRHTRAADAAILLSSEIVFAALAAAVYLGERLNALQKSKPRQKKS